MSNGKTLSWRFITPATVIETNVNGFELALDNQKLSINVSVNQPLLNMKLNSFSLSSILNNSDDVNGEFTVLEFISTKVVDYYYVKFEIK